MGDVPEQVFIDAAEVYDVTRSAVMRLPVEPPLAEWEREFLAHQDAVRAAVASAYRAGQAATPDGPRRWALPDDRAQAKAAIHRPLHDLNVRIVGLAVGDCHCNLIAEVVLDALTDATPAADGQDGDGRG
jgi:hypothetical protein